MPYFMIHLCTSNDANGNPRRAWVTFNSDGLPLAFYEEECAGAYAIPDPEVRALAGIAPRINVCVSEWQRWKREITLAG